VDPSRRTNGEIRILLEALGLEVEAHQKMVNWPLPNNQACRRAGSTQSQPGTSGEQCEILKREFRICNGTKIANVDALNSLEDFWVTLD
jgi:hypothetical protein